jgi:hypothetical protein
MRLWRIAAALATLLASVAAGVSNAAAQQPGVSV